MKVVIFGAGIAGLSAGIMLKKAGFQVTVYERAEGMNDRGNAFLMHEDGLDLLRDLGDNDQFHQMGEGIDYFQLYSQKNEEVKSIRLMPWRCFKRNEIIHYLYEAFGPENIYHGYEFKELKWHNEIAQSAIFHNGESVKADLFIGADGLRSKFRNQLFGETDFSEIFTFELLGFVKFPEAYKSLKRRFKKFQHRTRSIAFGVLPAGKDELITVLQFDPQILKEANINEENHKEIAEYLTLDFPEFVKELINLQTYEQTYIWKTRDFDLLPRFHKNNAVLIGDSAHVALPFSSSGTTNALLDAKSIADGLIRMKSISNDSSKWDHVFDAYYNDRANIVADQIYFGRKLKDQFLSPKRHPLEKQRIPLVKRTKPKVKSAPKDRRIYITYFTDPICSTCWAIQPQLRKLELEFGNQLEVQYRMGGLLPHWDNFNRHGISEPSEVGKHWDEVQSESQMPISGEIWRNNPLPSSYPPSIAFKAAQLQNQEKALIFLRKLREALFVAQQNIIDQNLLYQIALDSALDAALLIKDINGAAREKFYEDISLCELKGIKYLPTLFFKNHSGEFRKLVGFNDYQTFISLLYELSPKIQLKSYSKDAIDLFEKFPSMSLIEFAYLSEKKLDVAEAELNELVKQEQLITWSSGKVKLYLRTVKLEQGFV
jgi:2-polyprenyl-6-methoxyphenol hydroxylase-like FAD-dependent oxidoreductase/predicted DsbA family dithiol-disulfide isomerase